MREPWWKRDEEAARRAFEAKGADLRTDEHLHELHVAQSATWFQPGGIYDCA